jgi:N-acetylglucosaminyldiphosphoundecaprenol N-acetyl-beta-D-mannosaminyltransferase
MLGITVNALSISRLNALIADAVTNNQSWIIGHHNLHSIYLYHHDSKMRAFYAKADYTHVDGMALVFLGRLLGLPLKREHRVTYADWIDPLMSEAAQQGWRVFYLGSKPGVAEQGAGSIHQKFPSLQIATADGYFNADSDSEENRAVLAAINAYQPHLLMVGMGMPRQEHWILDNLEKIPANAILPCGACMDYVAGAIPTPPRWTGRWGLEWLFRLIAEPRRLWQRYLVEPWFLLRWFLADCLKQQHLTEQKTFSDSKQQSL